MEADLSDPSARHWLVPGKSCLYVAVGNGNADEEEDHDGKFILGTIAYKINGKVMSLHRVFVDESAR